MIVSLIMLSLAPLAVAGDYSLFDHTLSESGGQGLPGAWAHRVGVLVAAASVLTMTSLSRAVWSRTTRNLMRVYAVALVGLVVFPESAWDGRPYDQTVAALHTVSGVVGAVAFTLVALSVASTRTADRAKKKLFDVVVAVSVVMIPQVMLFAPGAGVWQRLMVLLGYIWLFLESWRLQRSFGTDW